ncbi:MAG: hypothetical protein IKP40_03780 [Clostridia bacterium]|nr:hypothetical protein [Clostridia bacterium]
MFRMKWMPLMLTVLLLALTAVWAEGPEALTWAELNAWADSCLERAASSQLLNDPTDPDALTEDGYAFVYDFATLYMTHPAMDEGSLLTGVLVLDVEMAGPRQVDPSASAWEALSLFRNDNPMLVGSRDGAVLYQQELEGGFLWGYLQRDGQRAGLIQYAVHERLADGITDAGLLLTLQENGVAAIRVYGLQNRITEADLDATRLFVEEQAEQEDYERVPSSLDGDTVTRFDETDLSFAGFHFSSASPEGAIAVFGQPLADETLQEEDGGALRTLRFEDCELVFALSPDGSAAPQLFSCDASELEGPRAIRIGDQLTTVMARFATETASGGTLYGSPAQDAYGAVEFGEDASAVLRYVTPTVSGRRAVLLINFEQLILTEYYLFWTE